MNLHLLRRRRCLGTDGLRQGGFLEVAILTFEFLKSVSCCIQQSGSWDFDRTGRKSASHTHGQNACFGWEIGWFGRAISSWHSVTVHPTNVISGRLMSTVGAVLLAAGSATQKKVSS